MHRISGTIVSILISVVVLLSACGGSTPPAFNEEAMLFNAVLIPDQPDPTILDREIIRQALPALAEVSPAWATAGDTAAAELLTEDSPLTIKMVDRQDMVFPGLRYLVNFGVGLDQPDMLRCSTAPQAVQLFMRCPATDIPRLYPLFQAVTLAAAIRLNGYVFDENAKVIQTPAAYARDLFSPVTSPLQAHVLLQHYPYEPGRFRIVTLGMAKFGAPEIEIRDYPPDKALVFKRLVAAAARRLVRAGLAGEPFPAGLELTAAELQPAAETPLGEELPPAADGLAVILREGRVEEGDPQSNVIRLAPPSTEPGDLAEWGRQISRFIFGIDIESVVWQGDLPSEAATAQATLPEIRQEFMTDPSAGGWYIRFRAPTPDAGPAEILVGQLEQWTEDDLGVLLLSEPRLAAAAGAGTRLAVSEADVVDWIQVTPAGEVRGNYLKNLR
ncbi:MAG: hypothetical protein JXQ27_18895 [Acidobacteria bacterium]|nr:hypothetical protein [Acidobacteriota bacterium]